MRGHGIAGFTVSSRSVSSQSISLGQKTTLICQLPITVTERVQLQQRGLSVMQWERETLGESRGDVPGAEEERGVAGEENGSSHQKGKRQWGRHIPFFVFFSFGGAPASLSCALAALRPFFCLFWFFCASVVLWRFFFFSLLRFWTLRAPPPPFLGGRLSSALAVFFFFALLWHSSRCFFFFLAWCGRSHLTITL